MALALKLGFNSVEQMLDELPRYTVHEWMAYFELEHDEYRKAIRAGNQSTPRGLG